MSKSMCPHIDCTVVAALLLVVIVVVGQPQSLRPANEGQLQASAAVGQQQRNSSHVTGVARRAERASSTGGNLFGYDQPALELSSYDQQQQLQASYQFLPAAQQQSKPQPQISSPPVATSSQRHRRQQRDQQQWQANRQQTSHLQHNYNYHSFQGSPNKTSPPMLEQITSQSSEVSSISGSYEHTTFQQQGGIAAGAAGGGNGGMGAENNPILYNEPNRTAAIDDIRSGVIYIFIITIFLCFFLILPGIRNDKFPTFLCITTSLIVTSIILISLFGTTWHVAEAPISAAYKAFSRDRIQGDLSVRIGLQSVNITLRAQKYYILHETRGPIIMFNAPAASALLSSPVTNQHQQRSLEEASSAADQSPQSQVSEASKFISSSNTSKTTAAEPASLADELLAADQPDPPDVGAVDTELEADEVFASRPSRITRSSDGSSSSNSSIQMTKRRSARANRKRDTSAAASMSVGGQKYTIKRVDVDINYNERFYWIEPNQMAHEHQRALERGLPYPILTVVEYLSQDDGGFNWSRKYRSAGYYTYIILWLSLCVCALMFFLHCAAPRYGIYTMQVLGGLLLFANLTYATLVPRGDQKLVIPFEGQSLTFKFGWSFWLVLIGGCLSLLIGTVIVIIDCLFPNFILTTVLDVDYDSHHRYYKHNKQKKALASSSSSSSSTSTTSSKNRFEKPVRPPFLEHSSPSNRINSNAAAAAAAASANSGFQPDEDDGPVGAMNKRGDSVPVATGPRSHTQTPPSSASHDNQRQQQLLQPAANGSHKNHNLKSTDHQAASRSSTKQQQRPASSSSMIESHQHSRQYSHNVRL